MRTGTGIIVSGPFNIRWHLSEEPLDVHKNDQNFSVVDGKWKIQDPLEVYIIYSRERKSEHHGIRATYRSTSYIGYPHCPAFMVTWKKLIREIMVVSTSKSPLADKTLKIIGQ